MRKLIAFLLSILLIFLLCSCKKEETPPTNFPDGLPTDSTLEENAKPDNPPNKKEDDKNKEISKTPSTQKPEANQNKQEVGSGTQAPPSSPPTTPETQIPAINEIVFTHTSLPKEQYYQYSFLSDIEKAVYNEFYSAAEKCKNILDLTKYRLSEKAVKKIYSAFTADCPQYFYISKNCTYVIDSSTKIVTEFILQYTDGTVVDRFDDDNKPLALADRQKINNQIVEFADKINAILSHIPPNISELEREKRIYEYITDTVIYDSAAEDSVNTDPDFQSFSFSAYGAACKGTAVCEGYVKLFQYLCYNSNINVTPVESGANMQHMWAAAKIDNHWYMADITWDDMDNHLICSYEYFNVTTLYLSADHSFGSDLKVPLCNSDKASFHNNFALVPKNDNPPENYREIIDKSDKYIYVYRDKYSYNLTDYIDEYIYNGEINEYIKSLGFSLGDNYYYTDIYYFIPILK